jgi:hypothetical protein
LESFEMWCWRRKEKISWTDHARNEEVLLRVKEQRNILHVISKRKAIWIGHILRRNCRLQRIIEGKIKEGIEVTGRWGRKRRKLLHELKGRRGYSNLNEEALDRTMWTARFGRSFGPVVRQTMKCVNLWFVITVYARVSSWDPNYNTPGTWIAAVWAPGLTCYRSKVLFCFLHTAFLHSKQGKNVTTSTFFFNCVREGVSVVFILNSVHTEQCLYWTVFILNNVHTDHRSYWTPFVPNTVTTLLVMTFQPLPAQWCHVTSYFSSVLNMHVFCPVLACFVGAAAAAPTKHARTGKFVHMLGELRIHSRA